MDAATEVVLRGNEIGALEDGDFSDLTYCTFIDLGANSISVIQPGSFRGLSSLFTLDLDGNGLTEVIDQLKPHSENLNELTNPFLKKTPTKPTPISDILTKYKSTSEVNKDNPTKMSSSSTSTTTKVSLPQREDIVRAPNECSTSVTSTKLKRLCPWYKLTRTREEIKDRFTEKVSPAKQQTRSTIQSTKPSKGIPVSSKLGTMEYSEHSEVYLEASSDAVLSDNIQMGTRQKREENITSENKETVTEHKKVNEANEYPTSVTSTELKKLHPWCKLTRTRERIKDGFKEKTSPAKQQTRSAIQSTEPSKQILISSNSAKMEYLEHSKVDQLKSSSDATLSDNIQKGTNQKKEKNVTPKNKETMMGNMEVNDANRNKTILQQKANFKKEALSSAQHQEAYPWEKEAAKNRGKDSPLSEKVIKLIEGINKLLPTEMKSQLFQHNEED